MALRGYVFVHTASQLCDDRCAQIYSSDGLLCTPANRAMSSVHKGAQGICGCAHRQPIMRRSVCTNLFQRRAIVHTSQSCYEWCAQRRSEDMCLCTPPANYATIGVHKSTPATGHCAHQPIVL